MWRSLVRAIVSAIVPALIATTAARADDLRFLALGDSYTVGEGVAGADRWPAQLTTMLRAHGIAVADPEIVAHTGWTTDELAAAMDKAAFHPPYALITVLIGVNNQFRGRDLGNYRAEFQALLERAILLTDKQPQRVIVVSIPDWGITAFGRASGRDLAGIAHEIDAYNAADVEIAKTLHIRYVDITAASRAGGDHADMLVADGLHPSAAMYRRWAELVLPQAQAALATR